MKIQEILVSQVKMYEDNAKTHTKDQLQHLKNSIKEFGFSVPIVINKENVILAGHGRYLAAKELGIETIPAIQVSHLTPEQEKEYRLVDNSTHLMTGFDYDILQSELSGLFNFNAKDFGFGFGFQTEPVESTEESGHHQEYSGASGGGRDFSNRGTGENPAERYGSQPSFKYTCPGCGAQFNWVEESVNNDYVQDKLTKAMEGLV